jgi:histone deacetylase 11
MSEQIVSTEPTSTLAANLPMDKAKATKLDARTLEQLDQKTITGNQIPIIYRSENNITFLGLQKLHPFDPEKYRHISDFLVKEKALKDYTVFIKQKKITEEQLLSVHSKKYLKSLETSLKVAKVTEFPPAAFVPYFLLKSFLIQPMYYQVGGTVLGGELALKYGWSICLSGGMHHAYADDGGGWCMFSDIPIAIKSLIDQKKIKKAMIIDLDAHQGNGHGIYHLIMSNLYLYRAGSFGSENVTQL